MKNKKDEFVVITIDTAKIGYFVFSHFAPKFPHRPHFNEHHCLYDYKIYKNRASAEKAANRIQAYYNTMPNIITKILTMNEWYENSEHTQMKSYFGL